MLKIVDIKDVSSIEVNLADASKGPITIDLSTYYSHSQPTIWGLSPDKKFGLPPMVIVKKMDSSRHSVTVKGKIDGYSSLTLSTQYTSYQLVYNHPQWYIV